jgi:acetyltransferase-like isoleucine patch superfamily enzyme
VQAPPYVQSDFAACAADAHVDADVHISDPRCAELGAGATIYRGTRIFCGPGVFRLGDASHLAGDVYVNAVEGGVYIGRGVAIGPKTVLVSHSNHYDGDKPIARTYRTAPVHIDDDVFIGAAAVILPGVRIGAHAVVGAGAVVVRDVAPYAIVAGVPAKPIGTRAVRAAVP